MSYLLEIHQGDKRSFVGTFKNKESIYNFIESIPFVKKEIFKAQDFSWVEYIMAFEDIPEYYEVNYNNYIYIISKFSFEPSDETISFEWNKLHQWDDENNDNKGIIDGATLVDAYSIENNEVKDYISKREQLFIETKNYYEEKGIEVQRCGIGSEDGEYVTVNSSILYLLDPFTIEVWQNSNSFEEFLNQYKEEIESI